jgi:PTH1 family peptidyl-tRNA hydrolase
MWLFLGLGNPGRSYKFTRHNAGFLLVEKLSEDWDIPLRRSSHLSLWGEGKRDGEKIILAKPLTYMNKSGEAAASLSTGFKIPPSNCLVICDDLDLPLGTIRLRKKGGSGGHKGLQSIIDLLQTNEFPRLRLGIGRPEKKGEEDKYVLSSFTEEEWDVFVEVLERGKKALETVLLFSLEEAMSKFNN